jgi:UDP-N-acetylglucosamine diphosphorylase / glucose-1-phosphate thymidylyltransferase / UDP-N-acetylgalactosamine diphosphorylase / glucosamine-1-phosphate N-acetyltransferase / galactosamine-1-phosphate N-acetyltransferase
MELTFRYSTTYLGSLINQKVSPLSSLKILGQPLIIRNIGILNNVMNIDTINIPYGLFNTMKLIQENFPLIDVKEFHQKEDNHSNDISDNSGGSNNNNSYSAKVAKILTIKQSRDSVTKKDNDIEIPINSLVYYSENNNNNHDEEDQDDKNSKSGRNNNNNNNKSNDNNAAAGSSVHYVNVNSTTSISKNIIVEPIIYPWNFLNTIQKIIKEEIRQKIISTSASVAKSSVIDGPCIIEDNVTIDDFCKIKGPVYIGKGSYIGTSSLIRDCIVGDNTTIGFRCEISKTYLAGNDEVSNLCVIGESVIGENVWFGGHAVTSNVLLTKEKIKFEINNGKTINIGTHRFGAVIGNNCRIGTSVTILPGRYIPPNTFIQAIIKTYQTTNSR